MTAVEAGQYPEHLGRYFGKYRGTVTDNQDEKGMGRIRAKVPSLLGDTTETGWALPCLPYAGKGMGTFLVPPVGAGVWMEFEAGDLDSPIWSGCWWTEGEAPASETGSKPTPDIKLVRSEEGLILSLNDGDNSVFLGDEGGSNALKIDVIQGKMVITGGNKVVIEASQIELVENATHALVLGDNLLQFLDSFVTTFNTHMHPGQTAGPFPVTPMTPPSPVTPPTQQTLLSTKVKTG